MKRKKLSKHDSYVVELREKIQDEYDMMLEGVPIDSKKRRVAEIDLIGYKGDRVDVFEVKCSHRVIKAKKQLKRLRRIMDVEKLNTYFYCGSSGVLMLV